jgi:hypothetical protein
MAEGEVANEGALDFELGAKGNDGEKESFFPLFLTATFLTRRLRLSALLRKRLPCVASLTKLALRVRPAAR